MNKLFKLKKWLTLTEAARRLSSSAEEDISEADVLRLGLDGELILSVDFVNPAWGKPWLMVSREHARKSIHDPKLFGLEGEPFDVVNGFSLTENQILQPKQVTRPTRLHGVFDLAMWGAEALDVERLYQELTDGPSVELMSMDGPFVLGQNNEFFQLLDSFEDNAYIIGSLAHLDTINEKISRDQVDPARAEEMRTWHREKRIELLERAEKDKPLNNYYPSSGLPTSCRLVIRNEAIRNLEERLLVEPPVPSDRNLEMPKPSHFLAISALLELLKEPVKHARPNGLNQSAIIGAILERSDSRGLSKRTLEEIFSVANRSTKLKD